jgi:S-adenosyl methyltransferase
VTEPQDRSAQIDFSQPHIARVYDYLLGGKDHYAADRAVGEKIIESLPTVQIGVRAQRAVLRRVVRFLVGEAGIRQLIDIGSGLPTAENVHQIAQRLHPDTRVVYVDNDPVVLAHARALLADDAETIVVDRDLRDPAGLMNDPQVRAHLDWQAPIGLLLCGILHHILDSERPRELTAALISALPHGSFVFIHHLVDEGDPAVASVQAAMKAGMDRGQFRTYEEILTMFGGLELVEPGLVPVARWRPDGDATMADDSPVMRLACAGVARKP